MCYESLISVVLTHRQKAEQKKEEVNKLIDTTRITLTTEIDRVKKQVTQKKAEKNTLDNQVGYF